MTRGPRQCSADVADAPASGAADFDGSRPGGPAATSRQMLALLRPSRALTTRIVDQGRVGQEREGFKRAINAAIDVVAALLERSSQTRISHGRAPLATRVSSRTIDPTPVERLRVVGDLDRVFARDWGQLRQPLVWLGRTAHLPCQCS